MRLTFGRGPASYFIPPDHPAAPGQAADPDAKPVVDHIAFTIENWNKNAVEAELKRRGLDPRPDTMTASSSRIRTATCSRSAARG